MIVTSKTIRSIIANNFATKTKNICVSDDMRKNCAYQANRHGINLLAVLHSSFQLDSKPLQRTRKICVEESLCLDSKYVQSIDHFRFR